MGRTIRAGSKLFLVDRIAAIETISNPRKPGWPEEYAAQILIDCGTSGAWFGLNASEWEDFQASIKQVQSC